MIIGVGPRAGERIFVSRRSRDLPLESSRSIKGLLRTSGPLKAVPEPEAADRELSA